jgi:integrase
MKSRNSAKLNRLDDMTIRRLVRAGPVKKAGRPDWRHDGGGLYLKITGPGTASWVFRYEINGRPRYAGLGSYPLVSLAQARDKAHRMRKQLENGIDPLDHREEAKRQAELDKARTVTFNYCADLWYENKRKGCIEETVKDLERRLRKYAYPLLENLPINQIDTAIILQVLEPIWTKIPITAAKRIRPALEGIFDLARLRGYRDRDSENPARWTGHLEFTGLPSVDKFHTVTHLKMLPYTELPKCMAVLQNWDKRPGIRRDGTLARCLQFMILTTTRPKEAAGARWCEIDFKKRVWNIPGDRMKGGRAHSVPLSDQAMEILREQHERAITSPRLFTPLGRKIRAAAEARPEFTSIQIAEIAGSSQNMAWLVLRDLKSPPARLREYVFDRRPQNKKPHRVWTKLVNRALAPMGYGHVNAHGFRASFGTWFNEETEYPPELRKFQLAHRVENATEEAYQRGTGIEKRRRMLQHWADYCDGIVTPKVVLLRRAGGQDG